MTVGACYAKAPPLAFLAPRTLEDMGIHFTFIIGVVTRAFNFLWTLKFRQYSLFHKSIKVIVYKLANKKIEDSDV